MACYRDFRKSIESVTVTTSDAVMLCYDSLLTSCRLHGNLSQARSSSTVSERQGQDEPPKELSDLHGEKNLAMKLQR